MAKVGEDHFRSIDPVMDRLVVLDNAAPFSDARQRVVIGMQQDGVVAAHVDAAQHHNKP